jgi:hypothetical protein
MTQQPSEAGVVFRAGADGRRSTSAAGRSVFAAALHAVSAADAAAVQAERDWRRGYVTHVRRSVERMLCSAHDTLAVARAGLAAVDRATGFARDGQECPVAQALEAPRSRLRSVALRGHGVSAPAPLAIPYRGQPLKGDALLRQLDAWCARGIVEPSFAQAVRRVHDHPDWLDLSDQRIVLLGAAAEIGPFAWLARRRAHLIAVDLPDAAIWRRLLQLGRAGNCVLHVPVRDDGRSVHCPDDPLAGRAGADLLTETPEVAAWLDTFEAPQVIGAFAYLDGAQHVRVAAAMDAIQARIAAREPRTTLALLATPTDIYAVPHDCLEHARRAWAGRGALARLWQQPLHRLSGGRLLAPNLTPATAADGTALAVADAMVLQQGPNYALAKRLQQWRALVAHADGIRVSIHVAPPSMTRSVVRNRMMAAAYRAAGLFGVEAFAPDTASALMAVLLVHDLRAGDAAERSAAHPLLWLAQAAHHGGLWRMPFAARSALPVAALLGMAGAGG